MIPSRNRSTQVPNGAFAANFVCRNGTHNAQSYHPASTSVADVFFYESVQDSFEEMLPNRGGGSGWKPFQHYKRWSGPINHIIGLKYRATGPQGRYNDHEHWCLNTHPYWPYRYDAFGLAGTPLNGLPLLYSKNASTGDFVPWPSSIETLKANALKAMLPTIKAELSLINSILELKDFKSIVRFCSNFRENLRRLPPVFQLGHAHFLSLSELAKRTPNGYLYWSFALAPLISDIRGIYTAVSASQRRINDLVTREGRWQKKHFSVSWPENTDVQNQAGPYGLYAGHKLITAWAVQEQLKFRRNVRNEMTTFHAEIEYCFNFTQYQRENARVLALLDAIGVNFNPSIIWNAIPWSFVIDWVIGVNRWLDQFTVALMEPQINIRQFLYSIHRFRTTEVFRYLNYLVSPYSRSDVGEQALPVIYEEAYRRHVEMPTVSSIQSGGLSLKEFSLGAALVTARRRR